MITMETRTAWNSLRMKDFFGMTKNAITEWALFVNYRKCSTLMHSVYSIQFSYVFAYSCASILSLLRCKPFKRFLIFLKKFFIAWFITQSKNQNERAGLYLIYNTWILIRYLFTNTIYLNPIITQWWYRLDFTLIVLFVYISIRWTFSFSNEIRNMINPSS